MPLLCLQVRSLRTYRKPLHNSACYLPWECLNVHIYRQLHDIGDINVLIAFALFYLFLCYLKQANNGFYSLPDRLLIVEFREEK